MARNDVHSPKNLTTEDYQYILAADNQGTPGWVLQNGDFGLEVARHLSRTDRLDRGTHQCHHCGAHIRYFAILKHVPTGDYIAVGETCLDNRFERSTKDFQHLRKQAELDRQAQRIRGMVADFVLANPDLAFMGIRKFEDRQEATPETSRSNSFIADVARRLNRDGVISERQIEAVRKSMVKDAEYAARKAAEAAARETEVLVPVVEGKVVITGEVLTLKWQESNFGSVLKMLVKDDRGFKVWGSVPAALQYSARNDDGDLIEVRAERGDRVSFSASVEKSQDDETFGFFKRPTKATLISKAVPA